MAKVKETSVDIIAEIRDLAANRDWHNHTNQSNRERVSDIADRLEAAHRREKATTENSSAVGDAVKLREALIQARAAICKKAKYQCQSLSWENSNIQANCGDILCSWRGLCEAKTSINAALAAPPRNCDIGTAEEQEERYRNFCRRYQKCAECPCASCRGQLNSNCEFVWAQMPYESEAAK